MTRCSRRVVLAGILLLATLASEARSQTAQTFVPRQVIIKLDPAAREGDVRAVQNSLHATVKQRFANIGAELWEISGVAVPDAVNRFRHDPRVEYIEPNYVIHADALIPNDPRFGELWGMHNTGQSGGTLDADIDAPEAWSLGTGGTILVGVIDTGVDWHHVELSSNIFTNPGEIAGNGIDDDVNGFIDDVRGWDFVNNDNDPMDDNGHGTHCSGTIAAIGNNGIGVAGVCWSARIMPIKFLDSGGSGTTAAAILAVQYATKMGVRLTSNSWGGGGFSSALRDAIADAGNHGILFVAAAGNAGDNNDVALHYPASYDLDNIIAVASTDRFDALSGFSNYGLVTVDLGAPGSDILSTFPGNSYATLSGTSMATPHVSGAVCLALAADPSMTGSQVKTAILATVDPIPSLAGRVASGGRLNAYKLINSLDKSEPARVGNLAVTSTGSTSALLTWTATGDDGAAGTASVYDLRYSKSGIYWSNFDLATRVNGTPHPKAAGSAESFDVTGLDFNTKYYFALVVADERGNRSPMSNLPNGTTLGVPHLNHAPDSFSASLHTGGMDTQTLTLGNDAEGTLDFSTASAPTWVHLEPPSGRIPAGQSLPVDVVFDATHVPGGTYQSTLTLATNDPSQPNVALAVTLEVTDAADIVASPLALDFHNHYIGTCVADTVVVRNIGTVPLVVSNLATTAPFSATPPGFTVLPGATQMVVVNFCPVAVGVVEHTLTIVSNDPDHPSYDIVLKGEGREPPVIVVSPSLLSADLFVGGVSDQTLTIANQGGSDLDFEISLEDTSAPDSAEVFGAAPPTGVVATGRPLSSLELGRIKASFPARVNVAAGGQIDRGVPPKKHASAPRELDRILGTHLEEVFGSTQNMFTGSPRTRGNLFTCTTSTKLIEHRLYMDPASTTQLWFLVYEGMTQVGTYSLISASNVSPAGPSLGWYSSGAVNVSLEEGRFYLIVASFDQTADYFNEVGMSPFPIAASFGELTAGAGWDWAPPATFPPSPAIDVPDFAFGNAAAYYQTLVTTGAVRWLSLDPEKGTIGPAASMDVAVKFDAAGVFGGDYDANVHVASNDPLKPDVVVPAHLHVTGAPDIALSKSSIDFGPQFIGAAVPDTLVVSNPGTDLLNVNSITTSDPAYTVDVIELALTPLSTHNVVVTFTPTTTGPLPATLTFSSNDPDEPAVVVQLQGAGVLPPVIAVSPASLSEDLFTGQTATHTLSITNSGESNLTFDIASESVDAASVMAGLASRGATERATYRDITPARTTSAPSKGHSYVGARAGTARPQVETWRPINASASGLRILLLKVGPTDQIRTSLLTFSDVVAVDEFDASSSVPSLATLADYDAVIVINDYPFGDAYGIGDVLADYVDQGGGVIMTIASFIGGWEVHGRFQTGGYYPFTLGSGPIGSAYLGNFNQAHPIMAGVASAWGDVLGATSVAAGAVWVANWDNGQPLVATQGQHVAGVNVFLPDGGYWSDDIPLIVHNAALWASGAAWLHVEPASGVVAPHTTADVAVTFNAARLFGGNYAANLHVINNDPISPDIVVPAALHVTGAPDIAVSKTLLDYGVQFIGASPQDTLVVKNDGTDLLSVTGVVSSHADYTVDVSSFNLAPTMSQKIIVTFAPTSTGPIPATLSITSNDGDEGVVVVTLEGSGVEPPIISVTPGSFSESLLTGETASHSMTISNTGVSPLEFVVKKALRNGPAVVASRFAGLGGGGKKGGAAYAASAAPGSSAVKSTDKPARVSVAPVEVAAGVGPAVLVIQDYDSWGLNLDQFLANVFGIQATVINSVQIANTDFSKFDLIITASAQDYSYYSRISANVAKFESFVAAGGVVQYQTATYGDNVTLAGGVTSLSGNYEYYNDVVAPNHPIVAGLPAVLYGPYANHNYLAGLPAGALVITRTSVTQVPTTIEYKMGAGTVIATGMTWEYLYLAGYDSGPLLPNAVAYSLGLANVPWLSAEPATGTVLPGQSVDIAVGFDAAGMFGGDYLADLRILNNDPLHSEVAIPVDLHVTGAPDIAVSKALIDYGVQFIGASIPDTLVVTNAGTDLLSVTSVVPSHAYYSVDVSSFTLAPNASQNVVVTFAPTSTGSFPATLAITSNDADEGVVQVTLAGSGVEPPVVSVTPGSFSEDLLTGQTASHTMTISNTGPSPLYFLIREERRDAAAVVASRFAPEGDRVSGKQGGVAYVATAESGMFGTQGGTAYTAKSSAGANPVLSTETPARVRVAPVESAAVSGPAVLVIQDYEAYGVDMRDFIASRFGIQATLINSYQIASTDFSQFDLIVTVGFQDYYYYGYISASVAKFQSFASAGGVVQYQTASYGYNVSLAGGASSQDGNYEYYNDVVAAGHPIVAGLPAQLQGYYVNNSYLTNLPSGAVVITRTTNSHVPTTVEYKVGAGTVIATGMTWEYLYYYGYPAGAMLGNAVAYSLSQAGVGWLSAQPVSGTVPPGQSVDVAVGFDATGLFGGDYHANLRILNNDPIHPDVAIPVDLHVTGAPDISVTPLSLFYTPIFLGESSTQHVVVSNVGSDSLVVSSISSSHPDFAADVTHFVLTPGGSYDVTVTFAPTSDGVITGDLTIVSNDVDEPTSTVTLQGTGIRGIPDIAVTPPLYVDFGPVTVGITAQQTISVANDGTGFLTVSNVSSDHPNFTVTPTQFTVFQGTHKDVLVSFKPSATGLIFAHLNITSDDPDEGIVSLFLFGTGTVPPVIGVAPGALADTLSTGQSAVHALHVSNTGAGDLHLTVGAVETPVVQTQDGGPDPFGYRWRDSDDTGGPVFSWIDVTTGTNIGLGVDGFITGVPLGFTFRYYDNDYTTIGVSADGWLSFNGSGYGFPIKVPFNDAYAGAIAPFAKDLGLALFVRHQTFGAAPNRQFVLEYSQAADPAGGAVTFEVILTEGTNAIRFQYLNAQHPPTGLGIESPDQTLGIGNNAAGDLYINPTRVKDNYALEFSPVPLWLSAAPTTVTVPPGASTDVMVTMNAADLGVGPYAGKIMLRSNDPGNPVVTIPVSLLVGAPTTTGVDPLEVPTAFALSPNHPNPFNPITSIGYDLPAASKVRLIIYDVSGRVINELVNQNQPAGHHEIIWDGRNASNDVVASGVYFYRLIAGSFVQTRKMVMLK